MFKKNLLLTILVLLCLSTSLFAADVSGFTKTVLAGYGSDPVIVKAVKMENSKGKTLSKIKSTDEKWINTAGVDDFMKGLMSNECSMHLKTLQGKHSFLVEVFVMDNKGANVALTDKTSDYWQGDEDKFTKSYKNGAGAIHYGQEEFDESSQSYLIQVSVPVMDKGKAIGAITFGIDLGTFDQ